MSNWVEINQNKQLENDTIKFKKKGRKKGGREIGRESKIATAKMLYNYKIITNTKFNIKQKINDITTYNLILTIPN